MYKRMKLMGWNT